jgi:hypothetical protein
MAAGLLSKQQYQLIFGESDDSYEEHRSARFRFHEPGKAA